MNILVITNGLPYPPISGGRLRVYNLLKRIAAHHRVYLAAQQLDAFDPAELDGARAICAELITGTIQRGSPISHLPGLFRYLVQGIPLELKFFYSRELAAKLRHLFQTVRFDVVQIEESILAPYLKIIPPGPKRIVSLYDIDFAKAARITAIEADPAHRLRKRIHAAMMRRWEPAVLERFDRCITVSEPDRDLLHSANPRVPVTVIPNGVDTVCNQPLPRAGRPHLLFVGSMSYAPCVDAMLYFTREVLPGLTQRFPDLKLTIVGANPSDEIHALQSDSIDVTGRVPDVQPYYAASDIVIVPLRAGGGTRLKILEAMAFGRAVVSTSIGAEGLDLRHDEHLLLADAPDAFIEHISALLRDPALYTRLTGSARQQVVDHYDWDIMAAQMMRLYEDVTA